MSPQLRHLARDLRDVACLWPLELVALVPTSWVMGFGSALLLMGALLAALASYLWTRHELSAGRRAYRQLATFPGR